VRVISRLNHIIFPKINQERFKEKKASPMTRFFPSLLNYFGEIKMKKYK